MIERTIIPPAGHVRFARVMVAIIAALGLASTVSNQFMETVVQLWRALATAAVFMVALVVCLGIVSDAWQEKAE